MDKILIITFHRAQSYGAFLQAYALQNCKVLYKYSPVIIDYFPKRFHYSNYIKVSRDGNALKFLIKIIPALVCKTRMHISTQYYVRNYLKVTSRQYHSWMELKNLTEENSLFISGSDQIWDLRYDDIDNVLPYFLNFTTQKKVSYASSCGEMKFYDNRNDSRYKQVLDELKKYIYISTRETESAIDINSCGEFNAEMMIDPTFLLTADDWNKCISDKRTKEKYILVYGLYRNPSVIMYAQRLAEREHLKIYNVCDMLDYIPNARNIINITPFKLLWLIKNAEHVVTDSFHGCALSVNFTKKLHIFMPQTSKIRILNLVDLLGLKDRLVKDNNELLGRMDYIAISNKLEIERKKAYEYLRKCVKLIEE